MLELIKGANLALRFLLELCALGALGYWGFKTGGGLAAKIGLGSAHRLLLRSCRACSSLLGRLWICSRSWSCSFRCWSSGRPQRLWWPPAIERWLWCLG